MNTEQKDISNIIQENMMDYSYSVLTDRALPAIQDGMKPVTRRIMLTLHYNNISKLTKSMVVTGMVTKLHPHGTTYPTIVGMAQKDNFQTPLIDGHGNFSMYASRDLQAGADRYTEIKISDFGKQMNSLISKKVVPTTFNYDGTIEIPVVIPVTFPLILTQAQSGIGVGFSSSTLSYNMKEVAETISHYIDTGIVFPMYPDFPSRGEILINEEELNNGLYGKSSFTVRGKIESIDKQTIRITEFPYGVTYESVIDKIIDLVKKGQLPGVTDVKDLNDLNGINVEIYTRKNANHKQLIKDILSKTQLQTKITSNPNMIDIMDGNPRIYGLKETIEVWVDWRKNVYKKQLLSDLDVLTTKLYYLSGLKKILLNIDKTIDIIRTSKKGDIANNLSKELDIELKQAEYVTNMKIYNINSGYIEERLQEENDMRKEIKALTNKIEDDTLLLSDIKEEISDIANKYGVERQTKIMDEN